MTRRNLEMTRGDTLPFQVIVKNAGNAIDITGYSFRMTARYAIGEAVVFTLTSPGQISITNAASGIINVTVPPSATSSLAPREYRLAYDIQAYSSAQTIYTVCSGTIVVDPDVSITTP